MRERIEALQLGEKFTTPLSVGGVVWKVTRRKGRISLVPKQDLFDNQVTDGGVVGPVS